MTGLAAERNRCAVCRETAPLGLTVCSECGGTSASVADRLLFIDPPSSTLERSALGDQLSQLIGTTVEQAHIRAATRGDKALIRLPSGAVEPVTQWLGSEGIPTRSVLASRGWAALPTTFVATLVAVLVAGGIAAVISDRWMLLVTLLFTALLVRSAVGGLTRPVIGDAPEALPPALPGYLELIRTTAELRSGHGRELAAALARAGRSVAGPGAEFPVPAELRSEVNEVLAAAAEAARDLALLDESFEAFDQRQDGAAVETWRKGRDELAAARERLTTYLLEATGLVGRLQGMSADAFDSAGERLRELTRELREVVEKHNS